VNARCDGIECVDLRWTTPQAALEDHGGGELALVFPTIKHLEQLTAYERADDVLADARARDVHPIMPRVVGSGGDKRIVLPGDPSYGLA
jgi:hypothetical protein